MFCDLIIEGKQIFEFRFAFYPTGAGIYVLMQPFDGASPVFRVYGPPVGQFAVQYYSGFVSGLADKQPVACLIDFAEVPLIEIGIADNQPNPWHFSLEHFDRYRKYSADRRRMLC